jgi:hypothetical protein
VEEVEKLGPQGVEGLYDKKVLTLTGNLSYYRRVTLLASGNKIYTVYY